MSQNKLPYLKSRRTILRKSIPDKLEQADQLLMDPECELSEVKLVIQELEHCYKRLEALTEEIVERLVDPTEADIEAEATKIEADTAEIKTIILRLTEKLRKWEELNPPPTPRQQSDVDSEIAQLRRDLEQLRANDGVPSDSPRPGVAAVRLPKLEVEKFDGDILKFKEFWDHFDVAIGTNRHLRPVEKLNYLRAYLSGEAKRVIAGLTATDENYDVAINLLRQRYGDTQASIDAHYSRLMDLQAVPNNTLKIRNLLDNVESHLRCLQALGEDTEHRHFISLIMSKLPRGLVAHLEENKGTGTAWTVDDLRKSLHNTLNAREIAERQSDHPSRSNNVESSDNAPTQRNPAARFRSTTETLTASDKASPTRRPSTPCIYCGRANHFHSDCRTLNTVAKRRDKVRQLRRCFICLQSGHGSRECRSTKPCFFCRQVSHHQSLCPKKFPADTPSKEAAAVATDSNKRSPKAPVPSTASTSSDNNRATLAVGEKVVLQTAWVELYNPDSDATVATRALLDSGSNRTYITAKLAKKLGLKFKGQEHFSIGTFGSDKRKTVKTSMTRVLVELMDGSREPLDVNVVDQITDSITRLPVDVDLRRCINSNISTKLADPVPHQAEKSEIGLLIGNDYYLDIINSERIKIGSGLYLLSSRLGWIITGRMQSESDETDGMTMFIDSRTNSIIPDEVTHAFTSGKLDETLKQPVNFQDFWNLETIGIKDSPGTIDDDKALENFNGTVKLNNQGRYEVTWPWKEEIPDLPSNYQLALGRFRSLAKKFRTNQDLFAKYRDIIQEQEKLCIIEKVEGTSNQASIKHYIPHHPVITPSKATTKVRIVFDASAKINKFASSLNECLYRGPVILEDLCGLLLRFRLHKVAITADIEKAFLQVGLQEADRDVTRFFWFKDNYPPKLCLNDDVQQCFQEYRFCRVPFGIVSSPFLLGATIQFHLSNCKNEEDANVCEAIRNGLYVDNVITGVKSDKDALKFYKRAKQIFKEASMNLREWGSNSKKFVSKLPQTDIAKGSTSKVLGLSWDIDSDQLAVCCGRAEQMACASTKRQILKMVASFFDPLGFFSPILLRAKLLLRTIAEQEKTWDTVVDSTITNQWMELSKEIASASSFKINRSINLLEEEHADLTYQLHCFCDASATAYAAVVYLRITNSSTTGVNMVYSKTRLSPSKGVSIPRMELLAAVIGMRCLKFVECHLKLPIAYKSLWTDSTCVVQWLRSIKQKPVFVQNRLNELRRHPDVIVQYVKTTENPADVASRGATSLSDLVAASWFKGPPWLQLLQSEWPTWLPDMSSQANLEQDYDPSCRRIFEMGELPKNSVTEQQLMVDEDVTIPRIVPPYGIQDTKFSSLLKLHRVTAWISRFLNRVGKRPTSQGALTSSELLAAKQKWERYVQQKHFQSIFQACSTTSACNIKNQLNLRLDSDGILRCQGRLDSDGILRCQGRFSNRIAPDNLRFPVLLPKKDHYTELVIMSVHKRNLHFGISHTLTLLREEHWIPQGRSVVKSVLRRCTICKKHQGGPYLLPPMPPYPAERVNQSPPFSYVGLDYLGPVLIKAPNGVQKAWVCLFTCMAVRAVHLELVADMSTEQFLLCLRRFIARRGRPILILSDNAAQFKLAKSTMDKIYGKAVTNSKVKDFVSQNQIAWKFITENAPWMGGFYERLVGSVKKALKKSIGKLLLTNDQLTTCLIEIESVINQRPITPVGVELDDADALTPRHFLTLNPRTLDGLTTPSRDPVNATTSTASDLLTYWKRGQAHLTQFWKCWSSEYLNALRQRADMLHNQPKVKECRQAAVNDVVLVKENFIPRGKWTIGRICQLFPSKDGVVRSVKLRLPKGRYIQRPIKLLYPFELSHDDSLRHSDASVPPSLQTPLTSSEDRKPVSTKPDLESSLTPSSVGAQRSSINPRLPRIAKTLAIKRIQGSEFPATS